MATDSREEALRRIVAGLLKSQSQETPGYFNLAPEEGRSRVGMAAPTDPMEFQAARLAALQKEAARVQAILDSIPPSEAEVDAIRSRDKLTDQESAERYDRAVKVPTEQKILRRNLLAHQKEVKDQITYITGDADTDSWGEKKAKRDTYEAQQKEFMGGWTPGSETPPEDVGDYPDTGLLELPPEREGDMLARIGQLLQLDLNKDVSEGDLAALLAGEAPLPEN